MSQIQNGMPHGWIAATMADICLVNPRGFLQSVNEDCSVSFIPMAAVEARTGHIDLTKVRTYREVSKGYTRFSEGDVLFAKITPCMENGKIAIAKGLTNGHGCGSTEFHVLRPHEGVSPDFLNYFLLQDGFRKDAQRNMAGTAGQLRVPATWLSQATLPLPPLAEQRRIVVEVETQFTRLDASVAALRRAQANLKRYRASVLKDACEGRLVPTEAELARSEGRDYEPAGVLLERILVERRVRWESQERRRGKYKEPVPPDTSDLPEVPEGWVWATVGTCLSNIQAGKNFKCEERPPRHQEYGVVKVSSVTWGEFNERESKTCFDSTKFDTNLLIKTGDFLFSRANTLQLVGSCVIVGAVGLNLMLSDKILRFTLVQVLQEWLMYYLRSVYGRNEIERLATGNQESMRNIGQERIREIRFPLPPLAEQHRIVAEVERRLSVIQQAEATVEGSLARAERLRQSILKQAFSGKLVPQDPNDEPASVLLERIKAEREAGMNNVSLQSKSRVESRRLGSTPQRRERTSKPKTR